LRIWCSGHVFVRRYILFEHLRQDQELMMVAREGNQRLVSFHNLVVLAMVQDSQFLDLCGTICGKALFF
ncbi:MAG: hypothetical protein AAFN81_01055, partial [Bacteroidota bacterium]